MTESHGDFLFPAELQGWAKGEHANVIRKYSMDQLKQDVREMLKSREIDSGIWVFGYGSLMWNPDVSHSNLSVLRLAIFWVEFGRLVVDRKCFHSLP